MSQCHVQLPAHIVSSAKHLNRAHAARVVLEGNSDAHVYIVYIVMQAILSMEAVERIEKVTATMAKEDYGLDESDLQDLECEYRANPHRASHPVCCLDQRT